MQSLTVTAFIYGAILNMAAARDKTPTTEKMGEVCYADGAIPVDVAGDVHTGSTSLEARSHPIGVRSLVLTSSRPINQSDSPASLKSSKMSFNALYIWLVPGKTSLNMVITSATVRS